MKHHQFTNLNLMRFLQLNPILIGLSALGVLGGLYMVSLDEKKKPVGGAVVQPSRSPFKNFIFSSGIIEADTTNIEVGTTLSGIVDEVYAPVGTKVKKGQPLFKLQLDQAQADLALKKAQVEEAKKVLAESEAQLKSARDNLAFLQNLTDKRAVSKEEITSRENNLAVAQNAFKRAEAAMKVAEQSYEVSKTDLDLRTVRSPIDGEVLQNNAHPGNYAQAGVLQNPLMLIGGVENYHVRVQIDEHEAWRYKAGANAQMVLRGNPDYKISLEYAYIEPYILPKQSLTGDSTERVDTRVLEVVYKYNPKDFPGYIGQQVDIYIETDRDSGNSGEILDFKGNGA